MKFAIPSWQKYFLRLLLLACLAAAVVNESAFAQDGKSAIVTEEPAAPVDTLAFIKELCGNLLNSRALMATLARPEYTILAFVALNVIVFTETGLLIGFFLPGDSLLVITGLIAANPACGWSVPLLLLTLSISAIVGDTVGYWIGVKTGPKIFNREKSLFFNKDHLLKAQQFYEKHGPITIILARFVPILRTFAPVVAGVGKMEYRKFIFYNVVGGVGWVFSMVLAGYFLPSVINRPIGGMLGREFHVEEHIEKVVLVVVFLSITPGIYAWVRSKLHARPAVPVSVEPVLSASK